MRKTQYMILLFLIMVVTTTSQAQQVLNPITESHIEGNVPNKSDFDSFMHRDLKAYFKSITGKPVQIKFEFLREGPTQTGIAYPKFYLWVKLIENENLINQGAVRVAAIEKKRFEITDYFSKTIIEQNPDTIYMVFPRPVCGRIKDKMKKQ